MKKFITQNKPVVFLLAILVFAVIVIIIAAVDKTPENIVGKYELVDASGSGSEMFKATVGDVTMEIGSDLIGTLKMQDQETPVVVDQKNQKISFNGGKNYTAYTMEKRKLTIESGGNKAVFKKK